MVIRLSLFRRSKCGMNWVVVCDVCCGSEKG